MNQDLGARGGGQESAGHRRKGLGSSGERQQHLRLRPGSLPEAGPVLQGQFWEPAEWP